MENPFLYPGNKGQRLVNSDGSGSTTIAPTESSETIGAGDCLEIMFRIEFAAAATGTVEIRDADTDEVFDMVTLAAQSFYQWNAGEALNMSLYAYNDTDQDISALYCQKRIN